jgi:hypothetical protein
LCTISQLLNIKIELPQPIYESREASRSEGRTAPKRWPCNKNKRTQLVWRRQRPQQPIGRSWTAWLWSMVPMNGVLHQSSSVSTERASRRSFPCVIGSVVVVARCSGDATIGATTDAPPYVRLGTNLTIEYVRRHLGSLRARIYRSPWNSEDGASPS